MPLAPAGSGSPDIVSALQEITGQTTVAPALINTLKDIAAATAAAPSNAPTIGQLTTQFVRLNTQSTSGITAGFTAGAGTAASSGSTFTGSLGTKAYTVGDIVHALKVAGILAS